MKMGEANMKLPRERNYKVRFPSDCQGLSLLELLCVLGVIGIVAAATAPNFREDTNNPLQEETSALTSYLKLARSTAISTAKALTLTPISNMQIKAEYSTTCSDPAKTVSDQLSHELSEGVSMNDTTWSLCFSSFGLANGNLTLLLVDSDGKKSSIKIYTGGGVRIL
jgi:prepilin-type N-terminal cleavage/methylation domain-containing protein